MQLLVKRGGSEFWTNLDVISNSPFTMKEFEDWIQVWISTLLPIELSVQGLQETQTPIAIEDGTR